MNLPKVSHVKILLFSRDGNLSGFVGWSDTFHSQQTNLLTHFSGTVGESGTDIRYPLRMNYNNVGDPLTFYCMPSGQNICFSSTLVYNEIPAKLMTFISLSCTLCLKLANVSMQTR